MLTEHLNSTKEEIMETLVSKGLADYFARSLANSITPNSTLFAYCHKCKEVNKIDFVQFDGNIMMHCNGCEIDIMNLDTELYSFIHFNCIKKQGEKLQ